jgi:hypothetical protein
MNKQIFSQNSKQVVFALLAIATLGLMTSPVKADDAVIQESIQESVITGNDNVSVQNSNQRNRQVTESRDYRSGYDNYQDQSNTGIVQRSDQFCDQLGEYNTCVQDAQQSNSTHTRRLRHSRY